MSQQRGEIVFHVIIFNMSYSQAEVYTSVNIRRVVTTCPYKILHEM